MYKNETEKREAFRDILHIIEKLPQDFEGCQEISTLCEKLAKKVLVLMDVTDLAGKAGKNMLFHSFEIMGHFTTAGIEMSQNHYYKSGYQIGRAFGQFIE